MKYMGSKARLAKELVPFLQMLLNDNYAEIDSYIEPFGGGMNVIDKIVFPKRKASDANKYLIALFQHLQSGGVLLEDVDREFYNKVRASYNAQDNEYEDWLVGNVGFIASFNGRWFDGGYAKASETRNYYQEAKRNIEHQVSALSDVEFSCKDYRDIQREGVNVIYCDPPYQETKGYATSQGFDFDEFWQVMREWSKTDFVLISEQQAPEDFVSIWEKDVLRSIKARGKSRQTEKLFVYKDSLYTSKYGLMRV